MLKIDFTQEDVNNLHYERYHHPHPSVQRKMEVLYLKSHGVIHKDICQLCQITKATLAKYIKQYQLGRIEELKKLDYKRRPGANGTAQALPQTPQSQAAIQKVLS